MPRCELCGYRAVKEEEKLLLDTYGCARTEVTKRGYSTIGRTCRRDPASGKYISPAEEPLPPDDSDVVKELFCEKYRREEKKTSKSNGNKNDIHKP